MKCIGQLIWTQRFLLSKGFGEHWQCNVNSDQCWFPSNYSATCNNKHFYYPPSPRIGLEVGLEVRLGLGLAFGLGEGWVGSCLEIFVEPECQCQSYTCTTIQGLHFSVLIILRIFERGYPCPEWTKRLTIRIEKEKSSWCQNCL